MSTINEEQLNLEIRKFLKIVGVTSQREIERAAREAAESGRLTSGGVSAKVTLEIPALNLEHVIDHDLTLI
jgi:hypothetical protein